MYNCRCTPQLQTWTHYIWCLPRYVNSDRDIGNFTCSAPYQAGFICWMCGREKETCEKGLKVKEYRSLPCLWEDNIKGDTLNKSSLGCRQVLVAGSCGHGEGHYSSIFRGRSSVISNDLKRRANDAWDGSRWYSNRRDQSGLNGCCTPMWKASGNTTTLLLFLDSLFPKTQIHMRDASSGDKTIRR